MHVIQITENHSENHFVKSHCLNRQISKRCKILWKYQYY